MTAPLNRTVMWLTFRQLFVRKRLIASVLLALAPVAVSVLFHRNGRNVGEPTAVFLQQLYELLVIGVILPLAAVIFATGAFGVDLEEGTIVHLLVKPLPRWQLVASRYVVAVIATLSVSLPAVILSWLVVGADRPEASVLLAMAAGVAAASLVYSAVFLPLGITSRRALVLGLLYIVVVEFLLARIAPGVRALSIGQYALGVSSALTATDSQVLGFPGVRGPQPLAMSTVWVMGSILLVGGLAVALRKITTFEAAERL